MCRLPRLVAARGLPESTAPHPEIADCPSEAHGMGRAQPPPLPSVPPAWRGAGLPSPGFPRGGGPLPRPRRTCSTSCGSRTWRGGLMTRPTPPCRRSPSGRPRSSSSWSSPLQASFWDGLTRSRRGSWKGFLSPLGGRWFVGPHRRRCNRGELPVPTQCSALQDRGGVPVGVLTAHAMAKAFGHPVGKRMVQRQSADRRAPRHCSIRRMVSEGVYGAF